MPINAKLVVVGGEVKTAEIKLRLPCTIGRGRGCTVMLPQALVSRQHCELFENAGKLMVRDLGSLNGTFVNNQKISEPSPVSADELLTIGTVTFRVVYQAAGAEQSPPAGPGPVMKSSAKETLSPPATPSARPEDSSQPLEIGDFNFEETVRPVADESEAEEIPANQPAAAMPAIQVAAPAKPAAPAAAPVVKKAPEPSPSTPAKPAAVPSKPTQPPASAPASEGNEEEEDDLQDFLKSLGSK